MKNTIYIIPGLGETCEESRYIKLAQELKGNGYIVKLIKPNWYRPLSEEVFKVEKDDVVIGFSFGAVIAYLISQKFSCKKFIFASLSPIHKFTYKSLVRDYSKHMDKEKSELISKDIKNIKINLSNIKSPYITLAGEFERGIERQIIVPKTKHIINNNYIKAIKAVI
ncbi:MAG: hypothetical protein AAB683_01140 [Patescibacteria group bacterium]